jgi:hypothetical protein
LPCEVAVASHPLFNRGLAKYPEGAKAGITHSPFFASFVSFASSCAGSWWSETLPHQDLFRGTIGRRAIKLV